MRGEKVKMRRRRGDMEDVRSSGEGEGEGEMKERGRERKTRRRMGGKAHA